MYYSTSNLHNKKSQYFHYHCIDHFCFVCFSGFAISPGRTDPIILTIVVLFILLVIAVVCCYICKKCCKRVTIGPSFVRRSTTLHKAKNGGSRLSTVSFVTVNENQEWSYGQTKLRSQPSSQVKHQAINFINKYIFGFCCSFNYPTEDVKSSNSHNQRDTDKFKTQKEENVINSGSVATCVSAEYMDADVLSYKTGVSRELSISSTQKMHSRIVHYCNKYIFRCCCCLDYKIET